MGIASRDVFKLTQLTPRIAFTKLLKLVYAFGRKLGILWPYYA